MSMVELEFPVLVSPARGARKEFTVRPLFMGEPEGRGNRFEPAMRELMNEVRKLFRSFRTNRGNMDELLWYRFNPELTHKLFHLQFRSGRATVSGTVAAAWFDFGDQRYVCLPGFDNYLFIAPPAEKGKYRMPELVEAEVVHLLREERRMLKDDAPPPLTHYATAGEFVTTATLAVHVRGGRFPMHPGEEGPDFASLLGRPREFVGADEVERVGRDLNLLYPDGLRKAYGYDGHVERLKRLMFRRKATAVALVGPRGVGKSSVLHEALSRHLHENDEVAFDRLQKVWFVDPNRVIAGMSVVGQWQNRMESIVEFIRDRVPSRYKGGDTSDILFVDNPVALLHVGRSAQNRMTISDVLKPYLEKRELSCVLEASPEAWKMVQEMDRSFADQFEVVRIPEPPPEEALRIVVRQRAELERLYGCHMHNSGLTRVVGLQRSFPKRRAMPGAVVDMLRLLATKYKQEAVGLAEVDDVFQRTSKLSRPIFDPGHRLNEKEVRAFVTERLVGQAEAVRCLVDAILSTKARLTDPEKPLGSFLFIGPTGVGKTEAAKVLSRYLFFDNESLVRFDMNEYIDDGAVVRLIGDVFRPEGQLTGRVRHRPFSVLLFDEIEKAHPAVHDLLLQVLGEGRLTDSLGRTVDFSTTIIILTSNLGASEAGRSVGFVKTDESQAAVYRKAVEEFFRPEFVNRIDRIVSFHPLGRKDIQTIARLQIRRLLERDGFVRRTTFLNVTADALDRIADKGFDPEMGGRALKRSIEKELTALAAERLIELTPDEPVLFELKVEDGKIEPEITGLPFTARVESVFPFEPPEEDELKSFFKRLSVVTNRVEDALPKDSGRDEELLLFKDSLRQTRRDLGEIEHDLGRPGARVPFTFNARLKKRWRNVAGYLPDFKDHMAQMDVRSFLEEGFRSAKELDLETRESTLRRFIETASLHFRHSSFIEGPRDGVLLGIRTLVEGSHPAEAEFLATAYSRLLPLVDPHASWEVVGGQKFEVAWYKKGEVQFFAPGPGLARFFAPEAGVHVFYTPYGTPHALQVTVEAAAAPEPTTKPDSPGSVIRVYCPPGESEEGTVTDVRTGLIDRYDSLEIPWWFWIYAAHPEMKF